MKTTFGFCVCCAAAGVLATVTAATEAIKPSKWRLFTCIFPTPLLVICRYALGSVKPFQRPLTMRKRHGSDAPGLHGMSPHGTKRTLRDVRLESGIRAKADVRRPL